MSSVRKSINESALSMNDSTVSIDRLGCRRSPDLTWLKKVGAFSLTWQCAEKIEHGRARWSARLDGYDRLPKASRGKFRSNFEGS